MALSGISLDLPKIDGSTHIVAYVNYKRLDFEAGQTGENPVTECALIFPVSRGIQIGVN
jgi:hypothetical protein